MQNRLFKVIITHDAEDGIFVAEVPTLSPCVTYGETLEEAIDMIKEAIEGVIESREANGFPVPDDTEELQQESQERLQAIIPIPFATPVAIAS